MCYPPIAEIETAKEGKQALTLPADYLKRTGYRLPTEAEWEYACRAGAVTSRAYGSTDEYLEKYAWYQKNSNNQVRPVGELMPNDLGLFDMYGNVAEWCQDRYGPYRPGPDGQPSEDREDTTTVSGQEPRVVRGGAFNSKPEELRSAARAKQLPTHRDPAIGFRVARTHP
jgi:formylglycine-generating enzyme required for sulfatase activity